MGSPSSDRDFLRQTDLMTMKWKDRSTSWVATFFPFRYFLSKIDFNDDERWKDSRKSAGFLPAFQKRLATSSPII